MPGHQIYGGTNRSEGADLPPTLDADVEHLHAEVSRLEKLVQKTCPPSLIISV